LLISNWSSLGPLSSHMSASLSSIWLSWFMELQITSPARGWGAGGASRIEAPICGFDRMQPLLAPSSCEFSLLCVSVGWAAASTENSLDGNWSFGLVLTLVRNGLDMMGIEGKQVQFGLDYSHTWAGLDWFGPKLFGLRLLEIVDRRVVWHQFNLSGNTGKVSAFSKEMGTCDWSFPTSPAASDWPPSPPLTHPL
jgi:hypothetical protein